MINPETIGAMGTLALGVSIWIWKEWSKISTFFKFTKKEKEQVRDMGCDEKMQQRHESYFQEIFPLIRDMNSTVTGLEKSIEYLTESTRQNTQNISQIMTLAIRLEALISSNPTEYQARNVLRENNQLDNYHNGIKKAILIVDDDPDHRFLIADKIKFTEKHLRENYEASLKMAKDLNGTLGTIYCDYHLWDKKTALDFYNDIGNIKKSVDFIVYTFDDTFLENPPPGIRVLSKQDLYVELENKF